MEAVGEPPPLRLADDGELLIPGRHRATLEQVYDMFVAEAPFRETRERIWAAFDVYQAEVFRMLPSARLWLDGGFVTYKTWAAPKDIDVCIVAPFDEVKAAETELPPLLTDITTDPRRQPMGGLVDGFVTVPRPHPDSNTQYWAQEWSRVRDWSGNEDGSRRKGFVEVVA